MTAPPPPLGRPVTSIDEAIARMEAIDAALPATDGLACFNRVYLEIVQQLANDLDQQVFSDPEFLTNLNVVFANIYFDAVDSLTTGPQHLPEAWAPLLNVRGNADVEPIQFALAGMNAHFTHDLPIAVVTACDAMGSAPGDGSHYADYQKVDELLDAAEQSVRQSFESDVVLVADRHIEAVNNVVADWSVTAASDVAWETSLALWAIRDIGFARDLLLDSLARTVAMASRGLLAAV